MKIFLLLVYICLFFNSLSAQENQLKNINQLNVKGESEIKVLSDQAEFTFSVVGFGPSLREAVNNAQNKIREISENLFKVGLSKNDLETSSFYSGENIGGKAFLSSSKDFRTRISVDVKIDSLKLLDEVILTLSESKVEDLSDIKFSIKDLGKVRDNARSHAIENAINKANQMANDAKVKLKKIIYISEDLPIINNYEAIHNLSCISIRGVEEKSFQQISAFYEKYISISQQIFIVYEIE